MALSIIMFSGTADKFIPLGVLTQTAANLGVPVSIFVTGWALAGFLKDGQKNVNRMPVEFADMVPMLEKGMHDIKAPSWYEMLKSAKEIGDVKIYACSLMTEIFKIKSKEQLDGIVDDIVGAASFMQQSGQNQIIFI
ncbi:MAG: DsrE/DsrF/DrsH-like family protein [Thaumarchaeota archaeon]|nr:DsrE/DsrF/DrsH-like family protein [Nitrososphaerota archaeon]